MMDVCPVSASWRTEGACYELAEGACPELAEGLDYWTGNVASRKMVSSDSGS